MGFVRALLRALSGAGRLDVLGAVAGPRSVRLICEVARGALVASPISGVECVYYHSEIGEIVELPFPDLRFPRERQVFRPFGDFRSDGDLGLSTEDDKSILIPGGHFIVRGDAFARVGKTLGEIPEAVQGLVASKALTTGSLGYREIALRAGDRVEVSGTVEAVFTQSTSSYRSQPGVALRMRPEREPIVVEIRSSRAKRPLALG